MNEALRSAHEMRISALRNGDYATVDLYVAEELIYCSPHGKIQNKSEVFEKFLSGEVMIERMDIIESEILEYDKTAIISYTIDFKMLENNLPTEGMVRSTAVYIEFDDGWKLVSQHQTLVNDPLKIKTS